MSKREALLKHAYTIFNILFMVTPYLAAPYHLSNHLAIYLQRHKHFTYKVKSSIACEHK